MTVVILCLHPGQKPTDALVGITHQAIRNRHHIAGAVLWALLGAPPSR